MIMHRPLRTPYEPALLALADGTVFRGVAVGAPGHASGEVVFNTAMTGYQEILSDPSYSRQLVTLTYPHIGNTGINTEDDESSRIHAAGLVLRNPPLPPSSFRATQSLSGYLRAQNVVAIAGIDTRKLTRILRDGGAQAGAIVTGTEHPRRALELASSFPGMRGMNLVGAVATPVPYDWDQTEWAPGRGFGRQRAPRFHVVALDFGVKRNILRMLATRGCRVTVVPAGASAAQVQGLAPDGVFLSNGPGDPEACADAIEVSRALIEQGTPIFGICLGHQIMALASGARAVKMRHGHHGANHPVLELETGRVMITSQNHGFAIDPGSLPASCRVTHVSLFDGTLQGFARTDRPAFCFQGHPEGAPGPSEIHRLFDRFVTLMEERNHAEA